MFSKLFSELIILILTILVSSRFLYINKIHYDRLAIIAVLIFPLALINALSWGFGLVETVLLLMGIVIYFTNVRSYSRIKHHLALDHFSIAFIVVSSLSIILSLFIGVVLVLNRPFYEDLTKQNIYKQTENYTGSFEEGFNSTNTPFVLRNGIITTYSFHREEMEKVPEELINQINEQRFPQNQSKAPIKANSKEFAPPPELTNSDGKRKIVVLLPNKSVSPNDYIPLTKALVAQGYTVYTGEFFTKEHKWFNTPFNLRIFRQHLFCYRNILNLNIELNDQQTYYQDELLALLDIIQVEQDDTVFLIGDKDSHQALKSVHEMRFDTVDAWTDLAELQGFETPGFGFVRHTNPLLAKKLGIDRNDETQHGAEIASTIISEMEFQGQLNTFAREQQENDYRTDDTPSIENFTSETADTVEIEETELELE